MSDARDAAPGHRAAGRVSRLVRKGPGRGPSPSPSPDTEPFGRVTAEFEAAGAHHAGAPAAGGAGGAGARPVSWPPGGPGAELGGPGAEPGGPGAGFLPAPLRVGSELSARLSALARLIQIGSARSDRDGISPKLIDDAGDLLARAGERLRLSSSHTVVALAGGTGSGKSSLFNKIAGADFSTVGVTRPVTRDVHACVWGVSGSGPLLEWLGVPRRYRYARASALDGGEQSMAGLVLLDLPDHDSVMAHATDQVDQLVEQADLMIWVLDPQKYADAAVHRRFLVPLAGHSEVIAVVLNQADILSPEQVEDCVNDLRRLLDAEDLHDVQIVVTSAVTGSGVDGLLSLLAKTVSARRAATARIAADVDALVTRFRPYGGPDPGPFTAAAAGAARGRTGSPASDSTAVARILGASPSRLAAAFARAAGVSAIGDALQSARELRAVDYVGWPVTWLVERVVRRDPVRKIRLGKLWAELRGVTAGPSGAQQSEIDNALTELADEVSPALPKPWSNTIRVAIRSRAADIPAALGERIGAALPAENSIAPWWRAVGVWQGLLLGGSLVGLAWIVAILVFGVFHAATVPHLFRAVGLLPVLVLLLAAAMVLGWLTANSCLKAVRTAAVLENEQVAEDMQNRMARVAQELVVVPAQQELAELERFRAELRAASGHPS
ncbi:MAG TPA: GTPase [Streptosporangiaceae bacterium]|nr:GTPase [Streptosporangiaceae bacterium]